MAQLGPLPGISQGQNQGVSRAALLYKGSEDKSTSGLIQVIGQIHFLAAVVLRSPFLPDYQSEAAL